MKILGREPALWLALAGALISALGAFVVDLNVEQEGTLNFVVFSLVGLLTALSVRDGISAAVLGLVKGLLALAVSFGLALTPESQSVLLTLVAAVTAMFVRTQVTAPVGPPPA